MLPSFLAGPAIGAAVVLVGLSGGWTWLRLVHDPAIRTEYAQELNRQVSDARIEGQKRAMQAIADAEFGFRQRQAESTTIRERIIRVPVTTACAASPAVSAAVDGLRTWGGAAREARDPGKSADVPSTAGTARAP